jgi:hypothetical protein
MKLEDALVVVVKVPAQFAARTARRSRETQAAGIRHTGLAAAAGSIACQLLIGWPAAGLGGLAIFALMWTISSADRTDRLANLIRSARSGPTSKQKK